MGREGGSFSSCMDSQLEVIGPRSVYESGMTRSVRSCIREGQKKRDKNIYMKALLLPAPAWLQTVTGTRRNGVPKPFKYVPSNESTSEIFRPFALSSTAARRRDSLPCHQNGCRQLISLFRFQFIWSHGRQHAQDQITIC